MTITITLPTDRIECAVVSAYHNTMDSKAVQASTEAIASAYNTVVASTVVSVPAAVVGSAIGTALDTQAVRNAVNSQAMRSVKGFFTRKAKKPAFTVSVPLCIAAPSSK